jgi:hypothetical protein
MSRRTLSWLLLGASLCAVAPVLAQQARPAPARDAATISDRAGQDLSGRAAINQAAGSGNTQANLAALALSPGGLGLGLVGVQARQLPQGAAVRDASVRIDRQALSGTRGLLSVNQAAGSGNAQLNLFALGNTDIAIQAAPAAALDDAALASVAGSHPTEGAGSTPRLRQAVIGDDAFRGSQGVVQVNQTAGVGNASTNAIVLQLPRGAP